MKTERMPSPDEATLTTTEAARRLGVSTSLLNKLRGGGRGPVAYRYGRRVVFRVSDVDAYAKAHRVEPVGEASGEGGEA